MGSQKAGEGLQSTRPNCAPSAHVTYDPQKHHRRSIRLPGADYAAGGAYFVTIVTHQRQRIFGEIRDMTMRRNACGDLAHTQLLALASHFPHTRIDACVVMPDHVHAIIVIERTSHSKSPSDAKPRAFGDGAPPRSISAMVQNFKSVTSRKIRAEDPSIGTLWQRGFYESIIRDERSMHNRRIYVHENPQRWKP
jgi:putative transposase